MNDLNRVQVMGRCVKQPDLTQKGSSGVSVLTFTLAVNRDYKKKGVDEYDEYTSFFDFTLFGSRAENLHKWITKGRLILVEGHLKQDRWDNLEGKTSSKIKIEVDEINPFIERLPKGTETAAKEAAKAVEQVPSSVEQDDAIF